MSNNTKVNNIKKVIICLSIVFIILLVLILIIYNNPTDKKLRYIYNTNKEGNIDIMPTNVDKLFEQYAGDINQRSLYKAMYYFVDELVEEYYIDTKDLSEEDIEIYFNNNSKKIEKELGITEMDKFTEFCDNLKNNLTEDNLEIDSYTINPNYIKKFAAYTKCSMIVKYNNNQKIAFYLLIQNDLNESKTPIYYEACTDEDLLSYEYVSNDYVTPDSIELTGRVIE